MKELNENKEFYVLAVSQSDIRLLKCSLDSVKKINIESLPKDLSEVTGNDHIEKQLQSHSSTGQSDRASKAIYHGHSTGSNHHKDNILHYFQKIDRGFHEFFINKKSPLILFCVDYLQPIFRGANTYQNLLDECIDGNPDKLSEKEIHVRSIPIARNYFNSLNRRVV